MSVGFDQIRDLFRLTSQNKKLDVYRALRRTEHLRR